MSFFIKTGNNKKSKRKNYNTRIASNSGLIFNPRGLSIESNPETILTSSDGLSTIENFENSIVYKFRYIVNGRLHPGANFSIAEDGDISIRSYPIWRTGRITALIILGTQHSSTILARVNMTVSLILNGEIQTIEYDNNPNPFARFHQLNIPVTQGVVFGLQYNTFRNRKGFTVLVVQTIDE